MAVDEALKVLATRPVNRWKLDGYKEDWDEETCAEVLAEEVERLRELVRDAYMEGFDAGISAGHPLATRSARDKRKQWEDSDAKDILHAEGEHHDDA